MAHILEKWFLCSTVNCPKCHHVFQVKILPYGGGVMSLTAIKKHWSSCKGLLIYVNWRFKKK